MTKLISGRVKKIPSANVSASRYDFIKLSETEPDLGLPAANGYVLSGNVDGRRAWVLPTADLSATSINALADVDTATFAPILGYGLIWNGTTWVPNVITVSSTELSNVANTVLGIVQSSLVANTAFFAANSNIANIALTANVANTVLTLSNFTTANLAEGANLYYTNTRVIASLLNANLVLNNATINGTFTPTLAANGNVSAYATKYTVEYNPTSKELTYSSTPDASNPYITGYSQEIHVSPVAFNNSGKGTIGDPVKTIARALELISPAFETTAAGQRKTIVLHPGDYPENVTINTQYTVLTTHELIGKSTTLSGTLTLTTGCTIDGLKMTNLVISGTSATGSIDIIGCTITTATTKTSTAYANFRGCDLSTSSLSITGAGSVVLIGGNYGSLTVNNASAGVLAKAVITMGPVVLTAGTLQLSDTLIYAATNTSNAITQSAGSVLTLNNCQTLIPDLTNVSRNSFGGFYSILHSIYDKTNSTFGGTSLNAISYSQYINADSLTINGGGFITGANLITSNIITSNIWNGLYTANVIESASNLYYTNARVYANVIGLLNAKANVVDLTTANVSESTSNLYFTNARVYSNVVSLLTTYTGNVSAGNIITGGGAGGSITGANLIVTNNISATNWLNLYTANVIETAGNLYFTNARVYANVIGLINGKANVSDLTTANVIETSGNLYFTNARVYSNVLALLPTLAGDNIIIAANGRISANAAGITAGLSGSISTLTGNISILGNLSVRDKITTNSISIASVGIPSITSDTNIIIAPTDTLLINSRTNITGNLNVIGTVTSNAVVTNSLVINGYEVFSNNDILVNKITSNIWTGIYTANVLETAGNLYFTNARVYANVIGLLNSKANVFDLTTANVTESASNLYFTNARVYANVIGLINGKANVSDLTTANVAELTNLYYTNARVYANVLALLPTLAGQNIEIAANGRISANITGITAINGNLTVNGNINASGSVVANTFIGTGAGTPTLFSSSNIILYPTQSVIFYNNMIAGTAGNITGTTSISTNILVTNSLVVNGYELFSNNDISVNRITANIWTGIFTANVTESASNLYFTNARVYANVIGLIGSKANISDLTTANIIEASSNLYFTNARVYANVIGLIGNKANVSDLTTANVLETAGNLYFTNARVYSNVLTLLPTLAGDNITIAANGRISATGITSIVTSVVGSLTTANVTEVASNLYYTNTRSRAAITGGVGISYDPVTGVISSLQNTSSASNVTFAELNVTGNANFYGNVTTYRSNNLSISDNMIYLNSGSSTSNPDLGFAGNYNDGSYKHTGFFRDATDGVWKVFDSYTPEPDASQFIDTAHGSFRLANLSATAFIGNVVGTVSSIGNFSTTSLSEGTNLYYTNARVASNITALLPAYNGVILASNITTTSLTANTINVTSIYGSATGGSITGADLISANNITATNITATYIVTGSGPGGSLTGANLLSTNNISSINWIGLYTSNVIESGNTTSGNVFFSNARAIGAFVAGSGINIAANGQISATASSSATSIVGLNTANVSESASNLYFTNTRAIGAFVAGSGINIAANGQISATISSLTATAIVGLNTANVLESASNLYYTNARVYANVVSLLATYTGNISAGNISTGGATGGFITGANLISANNFISTGGFITGANLISANNITATNITTANLYTGSGTGGFITGANLITSNNITVTNLTATNLTIIGGITDSVGILSIATTGANANIELTANGTGRIGLDGMYWPLTDGTVGQVLQTSGTGDLSWTTPSAGGTPSATSIIGLNTANVTESTSNLYFTNARVYSNVLALLPTLAGDNITIAANGRISSTASGSASPLATSIIGLNTANVTESTSNLYFTNARVYSNIVTTLATYTGNISAGNLITGGALGGSLTGANLLSTNNISSLNWIGLYTANVIETSGNLYFTNARVYSNVIGLFGAKANVSDLTTANVAELTNLYYTNARVYSNVIGLFNAKANVSQLTTANVTESTNNLYYTNARVYSNVISLLPTYTGNISANSLNITGGITDSVGILSITTTGGTNANIELNANGTGRIGLDGMYWPLTDGTAGQILQTSGTGDLSWTTPSAGGGGGSGLFNSSITNSNNYLATSTLSNAIVFSAKSILHSVYITNIDTSGGANTGVTATILNGANNAPMLWNMPLPYRSSFEALKKPKVVNAGDAIQIQGLVSGAGANSNVHATIVYEEITSGTYTGINSNIATPYANVDIFTAASASIIESVMVSSTNNLGNVPITVTITNSSNVIQGYMSYTLLVPVGSTIELCEKPRRIASGHKIQAYTNAANAIAIFVAAKAV